MPKRRSSRPAGALPGEASDVLEELARWRRQGMNVADQTAGIFRRYVPDPPLTPREETESVEWAVAEQVTESLVR
jgi:hypothetical protein